MHVTHVRPVSAPTNDPPASSAGVARTGGKFRAARRTENTAACGASTGRLPTHETERGAKTPTTRVRAPIMARHARETTQSTKTHGSRADEQPSSRADSRAHAHRRPAAAPPRAAITTTHVTSHKITQRNTTRHIAPPDERRPSRPHAYTGPQRRLHRGALRDAPSDVTAKMHAAPRTRRRCVRQEGAARGEERGEERRRRTER